MNDEVVTPPTADLRRALLGQVVTGCKATNHEYARLMSSDINPQPILYFSDPLTAEFATFGINPSAAELRWSRWPEANLTVQQLDTRLVNYFKNPMVPPNDWFDGYEKPSSSLGPDRALNLLRHSYRVDTVHLDFSPRATVARSTVSRQLKEKKITTDDYNSFVERLREMVAADLQWFLSALALCRNVKGAIMAGAVTNDSRDYLDRFLQAHLPPSHSLKLRRLLESKRRTGGTALYDLLGPQLSIPVLFVSASPSGDKEGVKLAKEVQKNLGILRRVFEGF